MSLIIFGILLFGVYLLHQDHIALGNAMEKIMKHLGIEEDKEWL